MKVGGELATHGEQDLAVGVLVADRHEESLGRESAAGTTEETTAPWNFQAPIAVRSDFWEIFGVGIVDLERERPNLLVVADDQNLTAAQQRRKLTDVRP